MTPSGSGVSSLGSSEIPANPTEAQCVQAILWSYRPEFLTAVLKSRRSALGGKSPEELLRTAEGRRRVYGWALAIAEGVMG